MSLKLVVTSSWKLWAWLSFIPETVSPAIEPARPIDEAEQTGLVRCQLGRHG